MRFKNMLLVVMCIFLLALQVTSCTDSPKTEKVITDRSNLQIYVYQHDPYLKGAVAQYNSMYKDMPIEMIEFQESEIEKYRNQLSISLSVGDGPDILYYYNDIFPSLYKMMGNKLLCNLNEIIKQDNEFNLGDYNEKVLNSGMYGDNRYFIPISYFLPVLWTTEDILRNNSISIDSSKWTWIDAGNIIRDYLDRNSSGKKYFFAFGFDYGLILNSCMPNLVNYSKKKTHFNTREFIDLLKVFKDINPAICPDKEMLKYKGWHFGMLQSNDLVMANGAKFSNIDDLWYDNSVVTAFLNSRIKLYPYPGYTSDKPSSPIPLNLIGIASGCKYKEEAFRLIKILLSKENQMKESLSFMPVNNQALKEFINIYSASDKAGEDLSNAAIGLDIDNYKSVSLAAELIEEYNSICNNMSDSVLFDDEIVKLINDELTQYLNGKESAEQAAKALDEKVMLYLNE